MAAINVTIVGIDQNGDPTTIVGMMSYTGLGVGGGPIEPGQPPTIWPSPGHPVHPIAPGGERPAHPIAPGGEYPGHPLPDPPTEPPTGQPDEDGFIKPPPAEGGWAYHNKYAWLYDPPAGGAQPK